MQGDNRCSDFKRLKKVNSFGKGICRDTGKFWRIQLITCEKGSGTCSLLFVPNYYCLTHPLLQLSKTTTDDIRHKILCFFILEIEIISRVM